jgi:uncharacterized protein
MLGRRSKVLAVALVATLMGCPGGNVAKKLLSNPEIEVPGKGQVGKCRVRKSASKPLIVEWPSSERAELESIRSRGTVVVRYDGCEMQLLSHCRAPGKYGYVGVSPKQDSIVMRDADELWANIPMGAAKLEGTLARAGKLTVAMTTAGRFMVQDAQIRRDELQGVCAGATHIITGMTVGAFEFFSGAEAKVGAGAKVANIGAGAKSNATRETLKKDGNSKLCFSSARGADAQHTPPRGCRAILRIAVLPLGEVPKAKVQCPKGTRFDGKNCIRKKVVVACPRGSRWNGSSCIGSLKPPAPLAKQKKGTCKDIGECKRRCNAGGRKDCSYAGYMYRYGKFGASKDYPLARVYYRKGCDLKLASACNALGSMNNLGQGKSSNYSEAARLFRRACELKDGIGCSNLAYAYRKGRGLSKSASQAVASYAQGCQLQDGYSCHRAGQMLASGEGDLRRNESRALMAYLLGCKLRYRASCGQAGSMYATGRGTSKNTDKARSFYATGCQQKDGFSCNSLGVIYQKGRGVSRDDKTARRMFTTGCLSKYANACSNLGYMYERGLGGVQSNKESIRLYRKSCSARGRYGCYNLAIAYRDGNKGVPKSKKDQLRFLRSSCRLGYPKACQGAKKLGSDQKPTPSPNRNKSYRGMSRIPSGTVWMGCSSRDKFCQNDERPGKAIQLNSFYMDHTEVTVAAYKRCVDSGRCSRPKTGRYCNYNVSGKRSHPVNCVSHSQARTYCRSLGKRLPTEAEWERAARNYNNIYPWGKDFSGSKVCYNRLRSKQGTCRVAAYPSGKTSSGLYDMAGNVFEWVNDYYDASYYRRRPSRWPKGPSIGKLRGIRGGCWDNNKPEHQRTSDRRGVKPSTQANWIGFRCAI